MAQGEINPWHEVVDHTSEVGLRLKAGSLGGSDRRVWAGTGRHSAPRSELAEEAPTAYKDVEQVVDVVHRAGLARLRPVSVVKG
jgi:hypothetical protein